MLGVIRVGQMRAGGPNKLKAEFVQATEERELVVVVINSLWNQIH